MLFKSHFNMYSIKILFAINYIAIVISGQDYEESTLTYCQSDNVVVKNLIEQYDIEKNQPSDSQTEVIVQLWIQRIKSLNIYLDQMHLSMYISEKWADKGLSYDHLMPCHSNITEIGKIFEKIWTPKIRFINSIKTEQVESQIQDDFVIIYSNGTIWRSYKVHLITPCNTHFKRFPMFHTTCNITLQSSYKADQINLNSSEDPILLLEEQRLSEYNLVNYSFYNTVEAYPFGEWTLLRFQLDFKRIHGWYILHIYGPSLALVFCSWISFCLGTAITARVLLTFGSLLALLLQYCYAIKDIPQIGYITYLDIWMTICIKFVMASIMELALFTLVRRSTCNNDTTTFDQLENESDKPLITECKIGKKRVSPATIVDIVFAIFFPVAFIMMSVIYWWLIVH